MSSQSVTTNNSKNIGRVKWFNNKSGYGFITFMNNEQYKGNDIFVHHSAITSKQNLYKYLVQGEYVEFNVELRIGVFCDTATLLIPRII